MNIIFIIPITCLTLPTTIDSAEIYNFNNSSVESDLLRSTYDPSKVNKIVDLNGDINRRFAFEVATLNNRASVVCSPHLAARSLMWLLINSMANTTNMHASPERTYRELLNAAGYNSKKELFEETLSAGVIFPKSGLLYMDFKAFVNKRSPVKEYFKNIFTELDVRYPKAAASKVNSWVLRETEGAITKLVKEYDFKKDFSLLMISVANFRNQWNFAFNHTYRGHFYGLQPVSRSIMVTRDIFLYGKSEELGDAEVITLQCKYDTNSPVSSDIYMTIILPSSKMRLSQLLQVLKQKPLLVNSFKQKYQLVELHLPKFKIQSSLDTASLYRKVGLKELLTPEGGGLNGILENGPLRLQKAWQNAFIEIDEFGIRGKSAGQVNPGRQKNKFYPNTPPAPVIFKANRPFLFFVTRCRHPTSTHSHDYKRDQLFAGTYIS